RLVLDRSHLWSSRIRGVREILAHPGKKPMGHRRRSEFGGCQSKTAAQNNNEPPCPRRFLTQPTEFEKSGVLQHPLARPSVASMRAPRETSAAVKQKRSYNGQARGYRFF